MFVRQCHDCSCQKVLGLATLCWWLLNVKVKLSHWFHRCMSTSLKCVSFSAKRDMSCQYVWNTCMLWICSCECIRNVLGMCPEMMWGRHHSARGLVRGHPVLSDPGSNACFAKGWVGFCRFCRLAGHSAHGFSTVGIECVYGALAIRSLGMRVCLCSRCHKGKCTVVWGIWHPHGSWWLFRPRQFGIFFRSKLSISASLGCKIFQFLV